MKELLQNLLKLQDLEFAEVSDSATEAAIAKLRRKIPLPILEHYDRLTDRGKKGIAAVRHQVCMGCHMRIPMGAVITLMHATDIQTCENCGRYLYLPSDAHNELSDVFEEARVTSVRSKPKHKPILRTA